AGGAARNAALDLEAALLQQPAHQLGGLELLHAELAEVEDAVVEGRDRLGVAVDELVGQLLLGSGVACIHGALLILACCFATNEKHLGPPRKREPQSLQQVQSGRHETELARAAGKLRAADTA